METPAEFIHAVTTEPKPGPRGDKGNGGESPAHLSKKNTTRLRTLLSGLAVIALVACIAGAMFYYSNSGLRKAEKLYKEAHYQSSLEVARNLLESSPENSEAGALLFKSAVKQYISVCAAAVWKESIKKPKRS